MKALIVLGSRSPAGQTARAADALADGLAAAGADVEKAFLPTMKIERCRQCDDAGWGICRTKGECVIDDDLAGLVSKLAASDAVVFATPVYFGDLSESLRAFLDRLRRTCVHDAGKAKSAGKLAVGVCVAGGGGGGAPACAVSLGKVLNTCGFDVADLIPVRRQNLKMKLDPLAATGRWLTAGAEA
jgi:multimeric flavodoxin WrbA